MMKTLKTVAIILFSLNGVYTSTPPMKLKPYVKIKKLNNTLKKNNIINGHKKSSQKKNIIKKIFTSSRPSNTETIYLVNDKASNNFDYASLPSVETKRNALIEGSIFDYLNKNIIPSKITQSSKDLTDKYSTIENPSKNQPINNLSKGGETKIAFATVNKQSPSSDFVDVLPQFQDMEADKTVESPLKSTEVAQENSHVAVAIDQNSTEIPSSTIIQNQVVEKLQDPMTQIKGENSEEQSINLEKKSKKDKSNSSSNSKEDNDESNTNPPSSYKSDENKKIKRSKILKKIKKLIKKLPKDKKDKENKDRKNDNKYFVTININELAGAVSTPWGDKFGTMDPCVKIGGEVIYSKWQLNFEAPMKIDRDSKEDKSLVGFNSQLNYYHGLKGTSRKVVVSIPFNEGCDIVERINPKIDEENFGLNTGWTKGKCFFIAVNNENYSVSMGLINRAEGFFTDKNNEDGDKNTKQESHLTKQFIQGKKVFNDKLIGGLMISFENFTNFFNGGLFADYELFNSGKLSTNPVKINIGGLLKVIFGESVIDGYQKDQKEKNKEKPKFTIKNSFLKEDLKGSFGKIYGTIEVKKIKINGENINIKLKVELKFTKNINELSLNKDGIDWKSGSAFILEWRIFKIKLSMKDVKIEFKNLTQKHKFLFNPYELKTKKADYLLSKEG